MPLRPTAAHLPFVIHALIETPAALKFYNNPASGLFLPAAYTPLHADVQALLRQYALLLFSSVVIAVVFACRRVDGTSRAVAGGLGVYHVGPCLRAAGRLLSGAGGGAGLGGGLGGGEAGGGDLGGPVVHLVVHGVALLGFLAVLCLPVGVERDVRAGGLKSKK